MINKTRFRVANDKKVLHKIGKRWVTVSALTLALLGGGAIASTTITHADTTTPTVEAQDNVKTKINTNLSKATNSSAGVPKVSIGSASAQSSSATKLSNIQAKASNVHKGLMLNATQPSAKSSASASSSNNNGIITLNMGTKSEQDRSWNFVQHGINNNDYASVNNSESSSVNNRASGNQTAPVSSSNTKANTASAPIHQTNQNSLNSLNAKLKAMEPSTNASSSSSVASANAVNANSNSNKNENKKALLKDNAQTDYFSGGVIKTGNDDGLNYKVYANGGVEFTDGTAQSNLSKFQYDSFLYSITNNDVHNAKAIKFDNNVDTSNVTDMSGMFGGDSSLQSLTLPSSFNTSNVTNMSNMFWGDSSLQSLTLPSSFDTSNVTNMSGMFQSDKSLHPFMLPSSFNTSNVTNMSDMFQRDKSLQSLTLPSTFDTSKVTNMNNMFRSDALKSLTLPSTFDTSNVTNMDSIFQSDKSLQSLTLPSSFNTSNVTNMSNMFYSDDSLKSLTLPSSFDTSIVTNMSDMFSSDSNLQSIDFGNNFDTSHVTNMSNMFQGDKSLQSLTLPSSFDTSIVTNMSDMFTGDYNLQSLTLPSSFDTSIVTNMSDMFNDLPSLQSFTIQSPSTKFNSTSYVPKLYKQLPIKDSNSKNYTLPQPNDFSRGNLGTFIPNNPIPSSDYADINYQYKGHNIGNSDMILKNDFNNQNTISAKQLKNIPTNYQITNPNQEITFNGKIQDVAVQPIPSEWDTISYEYQPNNQNNYYEVINQGQAYGRQGTNYTIQSSDVPADYQLVNPNDKNFTFGSSDGFHRVMIKPTTNSDIPAVPNTVNIKGTVDLHFTDGSKTKDIKLDYLTQDSDDKQINLLSNVDYNNGLNTKPSDFVKDNTNIQGFDVSNFTYTGATNNYDGTAYTPSRSDTDYNHGSTNLLVKNITLNFNAKNNTDPIQKGTNETIQFINKNGDIINTTNANGNPDGSTTTINAPKGYHFSDGKGHDTNTQPITNNNSTHNLSVEGNSITSNSSDAKVNVQITKQENGQNISNGVSNSDISLVGHHVGDTITINPSKFTPAGYDMANSDEPTEITITPNGLKANNANFKNNGINYNYDYDDAKADKAITVNYVNQNGKNVGTKAIKVPSGSTGTVSNSDLPTGYVPNGNAPTYNNISSNETDTFNVKGVSASQLGSNTNQGMVNLHIVLQSNGKALKSYNVKVDESNKNVGSDFTIDPNTTKDSQGNPLLPTGFTADKTDNVITGLIDNNGAITDSGTDSLIYDASSKPTTIKFRNPSNPNDPTKDITVNVNGEAGSKITDANVPHGYHLPDGSSYSFNNNGQVVNDKTGNVVSDIALDGDVVQGKANIVLEYDVLNPSGKNVVKKIYNTADDAQIILNGEVGGSETIKPWKYWKQNFSLPSDVSQQSDTIHFTPSDVNANDENGQQFNPTLHYVSTAQQAGDVAVRYVDVDDPIKDSKGNITGYQPIKLSNGKSDIQDIKNSDGLLIGQTVRLGQSNSNKNTAINNDSDVKYVLNVPNGYHLEYNANPIILQKAITKPSGSVGAMRLFALGNYFHRPVGELLTVGLSNPMEYKNNNASSTTTNSSTNYSSNSSASDSSSMIPAIATNTSSASSSASTNTTSSLVNSLEGNTYITNNTTTNTTNNYNYNNSSTSLATNSSEVKANANSNANDNSARTASDNANKSGMIDINNRPSKIIDTTTSHKKVMPKKINHLSNRLPMKNHYYVYSPNNIVLYGKHGAIKISRHRGFTGKILRITKFHGKRAFIISWKHKKFTVIAKQTKNAYVQPKNLKHHMYGLIKHATIKLRKTSVIYNSVNFNKHTAKRTVKAGKKLTVIGLKSFGEKGYERTRFVLSNGLIINANKNYVEFI